ncbi:ATP synthase gamma chain [hydrothermal vent metagenome]|uniref:ATP synthase gamma chain n=1 Tax=hydrothermal vent metagenome TaxID=652676 RepID=A0A1W1BM66_9ZZZZ
MANLKDIKRKINSVKNTEKTTRAMKLVSSAKLRRTEELAKRSRIYATKLTNMIDEIALKIQNLGEDANSSVYFAKKANPKRIDIVFITADKGLCGGFNSQTIKRINSLIKDLQSDDTEIRLSAVGRKGIDYYKFNNIELNREIIGLSAAPNYEDAASFISELSEEFASGKSDKIIMVHNGYVNMIAQEVREEQILPIDISRLDGKVKSESELEIEPDDDNTLLNALVKRYVEYSMYYALLDSLAAEHASRMQAMDAATNNAKDMVKSLSVKYNKARQEAITTELIEIISGMESMK